MCYRLIFNDSYSNWGHRDSLLSVKYPFSEIGVSIKFVSKNGAALVVLVDHLISPFKGDENAQ